jgi:SAM-dependent methyltransferase
LKDGEIELRFIEDICMAYFKKDLKPGKALDVACGIGYMSECLNVRGYEVTGFDINSDAISIAKSKNSNINFLTSDASILDESILKEKYDLILAREVHCFSRIKDEIYQNDLVNTYLDILNPGGTLIIAHSRMGIDTKFPSISYKSLIESLDNRSYKFAGPLFMFLYKHLKISLSIKFYIMLQSKISNILAFITGRRWIEFFIIYKE